MLCLFSSSYLKYVPNSNILIQGILSCSFVWREFYALLVSNSQSEVEVYVKSVVRDCCRAKREVILFCRQSLEALEHGFSHHEVRFCWLQL